MEYTELVSMISSVGFPIVMCLLLWYQMRQSEDLHREEINSLKDVIADVKAALIELKNAITGGGTI